MMTPTLLLEEQMREAGVDVDYYRREIALRAFRNESAFAICWKMPGARLPWPYGRHVCSYIDGSTYTYMRTHVSLEPTKDWIRLQLGNGLEFSDILDLI